MPERKLELKVDETEIRKRFESWKPPQKNVSGILAVYRKLALQADNGAGWETTAPGSAEGKKSA